MPNNQAAVAMSVAGLLSLLTACSSGSPQNGQGGHGGGGGQGGQALMPDSCAPDCGPTTEQLFDNGKVAEIRIAFDESEFKRQVDLLRETGYAGPLETWIDLMWAKWKHCGPYDNYVSVTMEYRSPDGVGDVIMHNVGMRFRGSKSRGGNDLDGFKLDFQKLYPDKSPGKKTKFGGKPQLNVLSMENHDQSLMVQCLAYKTIREFGDIPAPLCNHLKVFVNGSLYGVVANVEAVSEKRFISRILPEMSDGSFYGASGGCGFPDSKANLAYVGDTFTGDYLMEYDPIEVATPLAPEQDLIPMLKCGDVGSTPDDDAFKACISEWIDVGEWLKLVAAESLMPTLESFTGTLRNYYLYFRPDASSMHGGRFVIYSWDYDTAFQHSGCYPSSCDPFVAVASWFGPRGVRAPLVKRLQTVFKAEYCAAMNEFLKKTYKPKLVDDLAQVLDPVVATSPFAIAGGAATLTVDEWRKRTMALRDFIVTHGPAAQAQVDAACSAPTGVAQ